MSAIRDEFERVYREDVWGQSGGGECAGVAGPFARIATALIQEHGVRRVLDVGCGNGGGSALIDFNGAEYLGVDISEMAIDLARKRQSE